MAAQVGQGQLLEQQAQAQQLAAKGDIAPVLQQLNMTSLRTRTQDLHTAIGRILHSCLTNPSTKWSEVLGQFAMVNVELLKLVDDIKPILKMYVVYPKNVNAENAPVLPIMLSSKLLPEMEAEEAAKKEQLLGGMTNLPVPLQTDKLQRQIEAVRTACDIAEKVITDGRKLYGLGTRPGPVALPAMDKQQAARIAEQERMLRAATNFGEGLRTPADQHQQPGILPPHLSTAFATTRDGRASSYPGADGGYLKSSASVLPPSGLRPSAQQQQATQMASRVQTPTQSVGAGGVGGLAGSSPQQVPYMVNSPRSGNFNVSSPQQQPSQTQQQSQAAYLQRTKAQQQQQQQQLQRQHQQHQQLQAQLQQQQQHHLQQQQQQQQQQQLRHPSTPPIQQAQVAGQLQGQVAQPLLQQQKQQLQQQSQSRLTQQLAHHQQQQLMQQQALQIQERQHAMQVSQQQQLQSSQLQGAQNTLQQGSQVRPQQMGQQGSSMSNLYSAGTPTLLTSNVMGAMSQPLQSQTLLEQRMQQFQQGNQLSANQPQQNASSMLSDSWGTGTGTQLPQNSSNLGLPLQQQPQQQQLPQTNYMNMFNSPTQANFGQNRQQPPPS